MSNNLWALDQKIGKFHKYYAKMQLKTFHYQVKPKLYEIVHHSVSFTAKKVKKWNVSETLELFQEKFIFFKTCTKSIFLTVCKRVYCLFQNLYTELMYPSTSCEKIRVLGELVLAVQRHIWHRINLVDSYILV